MDAQPPKRRKTSPTVSIPVFTPNSEHAPPRASFMSPTHASLSRFNPSLLPQARAASAGPIRRNGSDISAFNSPLPVQNPHAPVIARGQEALNYILGGFNQAMQNTMAIAQGMAENSPSVAQSPMVPEVATGEETDEQMEAMRSAIKARKDQERTTSGRESLDIRSRLGSEVNYEDDEDMDELDELSPDVSRGARPAARGRGAKMSLGTVDVDREAGFEAREASEPLFVEDQEMDELSPEMPRAHPSVNRVTLDEDGLPETPEALRKQLEADDHPPRGVLFSSPSKRRRKPPRPQEAVPERRERNATGKSIAVSAPGEPVVEVAVPVMIQDPSLLAKQEEKAKLEAELGVLEKEVAQYERYAQLFSSEKEVTEDLTPLLNLISSSRTKDTSKEDVPALSSLLTSFLPFAIPTKGLAPTTPKQPEAFASHEPLKEKDALPLSSLFTPLSIASETHAPSQLDHESGRISQKHSITLSSPGSLLSCSLDLTISSDPSSASAPLIELLELKDFSYWATPDLGVWLKARCEEGDVAAIGYGLGRYWDVATKRAQCWMQCRKEFPHLFPDLDESGDTPASNAANAKKSHAERKGPTVLSKRELLPHLGRQALVLESDDVIFQVSWKLQFDWTGEVESVVTADAACPQSWTEVDNSQALRKIPTTFDALMRERGVGEAVKVVARLLFDTQV